MNRIACSCCLLVVVAVLAPRAVPAQAPPEPWVTEIGAPQYFAVFVEEVDRSVAWYRTVFGLDELGGSVAEDGSWRIENLGNEQLLVELIRDDRAQAVDRPYGFRKVGFQVPDVRGGGGSGSEGDWRASTRTRFSTLRDPDHSDPGSGRQHHTAVLVVGTGEERWLTSACI